MEPLALDEPRGYSSIKNAADCLLSDSIVSFDTNINTNIAPARRLMMIRKFVDDKQSGSKSKDFY